MLIGSTISIYISPLDVPETCSSNDPSNSASVYPAAGGDGVTSTTLGPISITPVNEFTRNRIGESLGIISFV